MIQKKVNIVRTQTNRRNDKNENPSKRKSAYSQSKVFHNSRPVVLNPNYSATVFTAAWSRQKSSLAIKWIVISFTFLLPLKRAFYCSNGHYLLTLIFCLDKTLVYFLLETIKNGNISATCLKSFATRFRVATRRLRNPAVDQWFLLSY